MAWRTWETRAGKKACGELLVIVAAVAVVAVVVVGRVADVSSVEDGRLLGRREVGNLAMLAETSRGSVVS